MQGERHRPFIVVRKQNSILNLSARSGEVKHEMHR